MDRDINLCAVAINEYIVIYCQSFAQIVVPLISDQLTLVCLWQILSFAKLLPTNQSVRNQLCLFLVNDKELIYFFSPFQLEAIDGDWEEIIDDLITGFEKQHKRRLAYSIAFY